MPKKADRKMSGQTSLSMATKMKTRAATGEEVPKRQSARKMKAMIPRTAVVEEEVPRTAAHTTKADISLVRPTRSS